METQSLFQTIEVKASEAFGNQLYLNQQLAISESDIAYCEALASPFKNAEEVTDIYILGGGHAGVLKQLVTQLDHRDDFHKATLVEIDIDVIRTSKEHLTRLNKNIYQHPKVSLIIGDALYVIENARRLNGVIVDLSLKNLRKNSEEDNVIDRFFKAIRKSLKPGSTVSFKAGNYDTESANNEINNLRNIASNYFDNLSEQHIKNPSHQHTWCFISGQKPQQLDR